MAFYSHMLTQTVDIEPQTGVSTDGSVTYGAISSDVAARVERNIEVSGGSEGIMSDTVTIVWLEQEVGKGDRITLPSGDVMEVSQTESLPHTDGSVTLYKAMG
jgi:hypothetical protein